MERDFRVGKRNNRRRRAQYEPKANSFTMLCGERDQSLPLYHQTSLEESRHIVNLSILSIHPWLSSVSESHRPMVVGGWIGERWVVGRPICSSEMITVRPIRSGAVRARRTEFLGTTALPFQLIVTFRDEELDLQRECYTSTGIFRKITNTMEPSATTADRRYVKSRPI